MARRRNDTDRLMAAEKLFRQAKEELQGINLRTYRGRHEEREAIQESRNSAECGVDWTRDALRMGKEHDASEVIDLREGEMAKAG